MKFYKDRGEKFTCDLDIEGASINESKVRLVLEFDKDKTYLFNGTIKGDGLCEVSIPPLKDISSSKGKAILEVIAESTYFTPWESEFTVEASKKVSVTEVTLQNNNKESLNETNKPKLAVKVKETSQPILKESQHQSSTLSIDVKKEASNTDKMLVKSALQKFVKLDNKQKKTIFENSNKYNPSQSIKKWGLKTFNNLNDKNAKLCTYIIETLD